MPKIRTNKKIDLNQSFKNFCVGYNDFYGRATRAEYFYSLLFIGLMNIIMFGLKYLTGCSWLWYFIIVFHIAVFMPWVALCVRRFRDAGVPVWLYVGHVALYLFMVVFVVLLTALKTPITNALGWMFFGVDVLSVIWAIFVIVVVCLPSKSK